MTNFTKEVIEAIENSPLWIELNANVKALYETENRVPSDEEYKAVRGMIMAKVMLEDQNVKNIASESMYRELNI